jgi:hypothetical protein
MAKRAAARGLRLYGIVARESETNLKPEAAEGDDNRRDDRRDDNDTAQPATDPTTPDPTTPDPTTPGPPTTPRRDPAQVEPPKPPPPTMKRRQSFTLFPEIAEAGGGRAEILKDKDSLIAEIAELTIADKYREEFADFFAAFRLLCR